MRALTPRFSKRVGKGAISTLTRVGFPAIFCIGRETLHTTKDENEAAEPAAKVKSVAAAILGEFFHALESEDGFGEIAPRLRKVVLEEGVFAEASIRAALFPDDS